MADSLSSQYTSDSAYLRNFLLTYPLPTSPYYLPILSSLKRRSPSLFPPNCAEAMINFKVQHLTGTEEGREIARRMLRNAVRYREILCKVVDEIVKDDDVVSSLLVPSRALFILFIFIK